MVREITNFVCGNVGGRRGYKPKFVVIHNTADNATAEQHMNRLASLDLSGLANGFAHDFIDENTIVHTENEDYIAWHTANYTGNQDGMGYEVCRSTGSLENFLQAEQNTFKQVAADMKRWGMVPNRDTVRLHKEFVATACPHRSWELHGQSVNTVKDYFISQIAKYMTGSTSSNNDTSNTIENQEESEMIALVHANGAIHYFNGETVTTLTDNKEVDVLRDVYKANHNGEEIPVLKKDAVWLKRLKAISKR
ncbi:N-acetylmuramoyl-L-alanine amidase [uncultured Enterococcus sp.]|uniref:N-acetylmuramoyl-L-alanine amidase n=1 Tax=uncultured Enterococcus sp. TaxID=167972 RepID=UPI002AA62B98|nr:N-acetylmuramoyl-L-alanine amidase [uncultured Enterococcus sp.]